MPSQGFYQLFGVETPFDPSNALVTSPLFGPLVLALLRKVMGTFSLVTIILTLAWNGRDGISSSYFAYFTHLSFIGLCAYCFSASVQGAAFAFRARKRRRGGSNGEKHRVGEYDPVTYPLQDWPKPLQALHVLLLTTATTFPILVTIVFWALLSSPDTLSTSENAFSNISQHAFNTVFALIEISLTNTQPAPWLHLPFGIILLALYLGLAYLSHATQGGDFYPYDFLNPIRPGKPSWLLAVYIVGIPVAYCIIFVLVRYLVVLRIWIVGCVRAHRADKKDKKPREQIEDWEVV